MRLDRFNSKDGFVKGKSRSFEILWYISKVFIFLSPIPWPNKFKKLILRIFGAKIGVGVIIKPRVNIQFPWKLEIGDYVWIGEEVWILNFEKIVIESHTCVSQRAFLCGGNHDYKDPNFKYKNGPITLKSGSWVCAQAFIGPNVIIEENCVVTAGSVVNKNLPPNMICSGNPCLPVKSR